MLIAAFDLEATGLIEPDAPPEFQPAIMEIGAIKMAYPPSRGGEKLGGTFSQLVHPEKDIPEEVQKITHITPDMVKDAPNFRVAFAEFAKFMTGVELLITFNGPAYDLPVLTYNLQRFGLQYRFPWPRLHLDLMPASSDYAGMKGKTGNKPPKLTELFQFLFDRAFPDAHRAVEDANATMQCAMELVKRGIVKLPT